MKPANILLLSVLAYFGVKAIAKKGAADKLQYFVQKVSVRISGFTPILDIVLGIQNPTNEALRIGSIVGDLSINGHYVAAISGYQLTDIKARSVSFFPISARLSLSGVVSQVADIVNAVSSGSTQSLFNQALGFRGYVNAEGVTFPLNFEYKVL